MTAAEQILEHWRGFETAQIEIPEWKMTIFVPPVNAQQRATILKRGGNNEVTLAVETLVVCAKDGQGRPAFDLAAKKVLQYQADFDVIARVAAEIWASGRDADPLARSAAIETLPT